jgi:hypothetical protein
VLDPTSNDTIAPALTNTSIAPAMVLPDSTAPGPDPAPGRAPLPFTRETQTDLTELLTFRGMPVSTFLARLTVGHLNLYAHVQGRRHTADELLALRDAARAASAAYWTVKAPLDLAALALAVTPYRMLPRWLRYVPRAMMEQPLVGFAPGSVQHRVVVAVFRLSMYFCATGLSTIPAMFRFQRVGTRREEADPRLAGAVTMRDLDLSRAEMDAFAQAVREGRVAYTMRSMGEAGMWGLFGTGGRAAGEGDKAPPPEWAAKAWEERDRAPAYDDASPTAPVDDGWTPDGRQRAETPPPPQQQQQDQRQRPQTQRRQDRGPAWTPPDDARSPVDDLLAPQPADAPAPGSGSASSARPPAGSWARIRAEARQQDQQQQQRRGDGSAPRQEDAWAARRRGAAGGGGGDGTPPQDGFGGGGSRRDGAGEEERRDFEKRVARERQGRDSNAEERRRW